MPFLLNLQVKINRYMKRSKLRTCSIETETIKLGADVNIKEIATIILKKLSNMTKRPFRNL